MRVHSLRHRSRRAAIALVLLPLSMACASMKPEAAPTSLHDTAWVLSALPGSNAALPTAGRPTLRFEGGRASGSDGCNRYTGPYTLAGPKLSLTPQGARTMRACAEPQETLAQAFGEALSRTQGWRLEAGALVLLDAQGRPVARLAEQASGLAGTAWRVLALNNGRQAVTGVIAGPPGSTVPRPTVDFGADGRITGFGGCNRFNGRYREPQRGAVEIDTLSSTQRTCADEAIAEQETLLLAALQSARSVRREGESLELRRADGALAVQLGLAKP